jgi:hypothetical protein
MVVRRQWQELAFFDFRESRYCTVEETSGGPSPMRHFLYGKGTPILAWLSLVVVAAFVAMMVWILR